MNFRYGKYFLAIFMVPVIALSWLVMTESGLRWAYKTALPYIPGIITVEKLQGSLSGPIRFNSLHYEYNDTHIDLNAVSLEWSLMALFAANINIDKLQIDRFSITLPQSQQPSGELPEVNLPWRVLVKGMSIEELVIKKDNKSYVLKQVQLEANSLFQQLDIRHLIFNIDGLNMEIAGKIQLAKKFSHNLIFKWNYQLQASHLISGNGSVLGNLSQTKIEQVISGPVSAVHSMEIVNLLEQLKWQTKVNVHSLNISQPDKTLIPVFDSFTLNGTGDISSGEFTGDMQASYSNKNLTVLAKFDSRLNWQNAVLKIEKFVLQSGKSTIKMHGSAGKTVNLNWVIDIADFANFYPGAMGHLKASGMASGELARPRVNVSFQAGNLHIQGYAASQLSGSIDVDMFRWKNVKLHLDSKLLTIKQQTLTSFVVTGNNNRIASKLVWQDLASSVVVEGKFADDHWQGEITSVDIKSKKYSNWHLKSRVKLSVYKNTLIMDNLCLRGESAVLICATIQEIENSWQVNLAANNIPVSVFGNWIPPDISIAGLINANASLQFVAREQLLGSVSIKLPAGTISYSLTESVHEKLHYQNSTANINMNDHGIDVNADFSTVSNDKINFHVSLPGAQLLALNSQQQKISADAHISIHNPGLIEKLLPEINDLKGDATLQVKVTGTLADPKIQADAQLIKGSLNIPRLGLSIKNITAIGKTSSTNKFSFKIDAQSGEGHIALTGNTTLDSSSEWLTEVSITGDRIEVARIPSAHILISPDVNITLKKYVINVTGKIHVPYAKLQPKDISTASRVSPDTVITGGATEIEKMVYHHQYSTDDG